jgi:hypothetical protein
MLLEASCAAIAGSRIGLIPRESDRERLMARGPLTFRQRDLVRAIKSAKAAGLQVAKVEVDKTGKITIITDKSDPPTDPREIVL